MATKKSTGICPTTSVGEFLQRDEGIRRKQHVEYKRLDGAVYLDNAGTTLYAQSQLDAYFRDLSTHMYGNPHSTSTSSRLTTDLIEQTRHRILQHFGTSHDEYSVIFTSGATAGFKLVAEAFTFQNPNPICPNQSSHHNSCTPCTNSTSPIETVDTGDNPNTPCMEKSSLKNSDMPCSAGSFQNKSCQSLKRAFVYLNDNHTSVIGMRETFKERGIKECRSVTSKEVKECIEAKSSGCGFDCDCRTASLFVYPGQSNFCGCKYPLSWIEKVQRCGLSGKVIEDAGRDRSCEMECGDQNCQGSGNQQNGNQNRLQNGNQHDAENGNQNRLQNGNQNDAENGKKNGSQNANQIGQENGNQNSRQNVNQIALENGKQNHHQNGKWYILLDAAALVSTSPLDLSMFKPDFVALSFYKMFGFPTGLGALLVRNSSADVLKKSYFGGGTVQVVLAQEDFHVKRTNISERFEDGTVNFLDIIALRHGFDTLERIGGSIQEISEHSFRLAAFVFHALLSLRHSNRAPVARLHHHGDFSSPRQQGAVVNFNLMREDGSFIGYSEVDKLSQAYNIHLRTGCFCNLGACQEHLGLSTQKINANFKAGHVCGDDLDLIEGQPTGSVRVSFGFLSTLQDAEQLLKFIIDCFVDTDDKDRTLADVKQTSLDAMFYNAEQQQKTCLKDEEAANISCDLIGCAESIEVHKTQSSLVKELAQPEHHESSVDARSDFFLHSEPELCPSESTESETAMGTSTNTIEAGGTLTHIYLYPVKSCGAMEVTQWELGPTGLVYDREWMVVTETGMCLNQKRAPKLCRISPWIDTEKRVLRLSGEDLPVLELHLDPDNDTELQTTASICHSKVCGDRIQASDCGDNAASWIQHAMNQEGLRIVRHRHRDTRHKQSNPNHPNPNMTLANEAPFLLLNVSSVERLHTHIDNRLAGSFQIPDVPNLLQRFRGNLVVQGAEAFAEETWKFVSIGATKFKIQGPCNRCQMICIDQTTGDSLRQMLPSLVSFRKKKSQFGMLLGYTEETGGTISVGDCVKSYIL